MKKNFLHKKNYNNFKYNMLATLTLCKFTLILANWIKFIS